MHAVCKCHITCSHCCSHKTAVEAITPDVNEQSATVSDVLPTSGTTAAAADVLLSNPADAAQAEAMISEQGVSVMAISPLSSQATLDQINTYRSYHCMSALQWSTTLASGAASWASQCQWGFSGKTGESVSALPTNDTAAAISNTLRTWYNQNVLYVYNTPVNKTNPSWRDFTLMVWKATTTVGCAVQECGPGFAGIAKGGIFIVCR